MNQGSEEVLLFTDGAARRNPEGPSAAGYRVVRSSGELLCACEEYLGVATNNAAEYHGIINGLEACRRLGLRRVRCTSDSELVVNQLLGKYRVKAEALRPLYGRVQELEAAFEEVVFEHAGREHPEVVAVDQALNQLLDRVEGKDGPPNVAV